MIKDYPVFNNITHSKFTVNGGTHKENPSEAALKSLVEAATTTEERNYHLRRLGDLKDAFNRERIIIEMWRKHNFTNVTWGSIGQDETADDSNKHPCRGTQRDPPNFSAALKGKQWRTGVMAQEIVADGRQLTWGWAFGWARGLSATAAAPCPRRCCTEWWGSIRPARCA